MPDNESQAILLRPRDGFFVKDGRGWYTAGAGRAYGYAWPPPPTVRGALTAACGRLQEQAGPLTKDAWKALLAQVQLHTVMACRRPLGEPLGAAHRLWPAPADSLYLAADPPPEAGNAVTRLDPQPDEVVATIGCSPDDDAREALWRPRLTAAGKPRPAPRWWTDAYFGRWLLAEPVAQCARDEWPDPDGSRLDVHLAIDRATGTARQGFLFSHNVVETLARRQQTTYEYGLACRLTAPGADRLPGQVLTLGGKSRLVPVESAPSGWDDPPPELLKALTGVTRLRLLVVTPARFGRGWLPDGLERDELRYRGTLDLPDFPLATLRAACVGRPLHLAGWDIQARQAKRTRRLVAPGAVYFLELDKPLNRAQAAGLWLAQLGSDRDEGLGTVVPGVWPALQGA
ncbi:MAG: hypothetical protein IT204_26030 [Fimbriimonadaceae bacterium]|nr:hypothetical protein [Fimbriimonadaceae bacterium]